MNPKSNKPSPGESPAARLLVYILKKLDEEPLITRAQLCEDLAQFAPSEAIARRLMKQANDLREVEGHQESLLRVFEPAVEYKVTKRTPK